tara:strand:- start:1492 stop:1803 length:312 start_codon:yes stop_codon:yes gene_type:complete
MADAGEIGGGAATGALSGASTGAVVAGPPGALVGGLVGALFGAAGAAGKKDPMMTPPAGAAAPAGESFHSQQAKMGARKNVLDEIASEKASEQLHAKNLLEDL